jgi:hypothetical protein
MVFQFINYVPVGILYRLKPNLYLWPRDTNAGQIMPLALHALTAGAFAAFNLGAAIGAWAGGLVIDHGPGLAAARWRPRSSRARRSSSPGSRSTRTAP